MKIGVILPIGTDATGRVPGFAEIRRLAEQAEASGLDSVWVYDHLLFRGGKRPTRGIWEAWTVLSAVAAATTRVEIGALVMCVPFRNPALLAKMAVTLDEVSGGRLILGLGAGWHQPEFDAFGMPFDHKVDRFEEALQIMAPLLREGRVDFRGTYYAAPDCELVPRGPRAGGPPLLIGAFGPRMLRLAARYADAWNTCWLGDSSGLAQPRAGLEAACAAEGRNPATIDITVGVSIAYPSPDDTAGPAKPEEALSGSEAQIAAGLRGYAALGVKHLICSLQLANQETFGRLAEAVRLV